MNIKLPIFPAIANIESAANGLRAFGQAMEKMKKNELLKPMSTQNKPTEHQHTTGAELQTMREACGLDRASLAQMCGVEARTVKHWETRPGAGVPADVAATVEKLARLVADMVEGHLFFIQRTIQATENHVIVLVRYQSIGNMLASDQEAYGHSDVHGATITQLAQRLTQTGIRARVVWFDHASYTNWREALRWTTSGEPCSPPDDTPAAREAWAASIGLVDQSRPHRGDQPPGQS